jgi:iron complex transport system ATP-binding protein
MHALTAQRLAVGYRAGRDTVIIADDLNLALRQGELTCLLGQNGAGKSTLLRTLAGAQPPLAGEILLGGQRLRDLSPRELARRLSIVTTERVDAAMMTGRMLVALGRQPHTDWTGQLGPQDERAVSQALAQVGGEPLADRRLSQMSDGERQRMMIARAVAQESTVMLLDEPTAFLDLPRRIETMRLLRQIAHSARRAVLVSTHDLDLALRLADVVWLMTPHEALAQGAPEDLVLNGAFSRAFAREGVVFDAQTGTFEVTTPTHSTVRLAGEGARRYWTQRALLRAGWAVGETGPLVTISERGWTLNGQEHSTLRALLEAL